MMSGHLLKVGSGDWRAEGSTNWSASGTWITASSNTYGLAGLLLTLATAFLTTYPFYERNLMPAARGHLTRLALAARLIKDLALLTNATVWPALQRSG